ncbi:MAG: CHAT domain-containing protein, partial [Pyrinomonadaceae bacterium]
MTEKIKILFLAANSSDDNRRRLEQEARDIRERIRRSKYRDSFDLITQFAVRPGDLQEALLEHEPHIVHFSGRGTENHGFILENDAGQPSTLSEQVLTGLFRTLKDNIRIIVFNACYTNRQAAALAEIVDYAIGINESIEADTAVIFSVAFYQALAYGRTVKEAFDLAITQLMLEKAE